MHFVTPYSLCLPLLSHFVVVSGVLGRRIVNQSWEIWDEGKWERSRAVSSWILFPAGREAKIERRGYCYGSCVVMIPMP